VFIKIDNALGDREEVGCRDFIKKFQN
jgi:hypothetical protein